MSISNLQFSIFNARSNRQVLPIANAQNLPIITGYEKPKDDREVFLHAGK